MSNILTLMMTADPQPPSSFGEDWVDKNVPFPVGDIVQTHGMDYRVLAIYIRDLGDNWEWKFELEREDS